MAKQPTGGGDWRNQGSSAPRPAAGKREWQNQTDLPKGPQKPMSRTAKLGIAGAALAVVLGGLIVVLQMLIPPKPSAVILLGASYDDNLLIPANLYGWKGLLDFQQLTEQANLITSFGWSSKEKPALHHMAELRTPTSWEKEWDKIAKRTLGEDSVILYLALHGGVDVKGPYFLLDDPKAGQKLYVSDLWKKLDAPELHKKNLLLVVEPALVGFHWPLGMFQNEFVARLKEDAKLKQIPNLLVLCASDAEQTSWHSEEWRRTIFGHFFLEGLKGAADLDQNRRVTAWELFQYVKENVESWSRKNRGHVQTPILLGDETQARATELTIVTETYSAASGSTAPGRTFTTPASLTDAWKKCQTLRTQKPHPTAYAPHLWRRYMETLLRYEQMERAGDVTGKKNDLQGKLDALHRELEQRARFEPAFKALGHAQGWPTALGFPAMRDEDFAKLKTDFNAFWDTTKAEELPERVEEMMQWAKATLGAGDEKLALSMLRLGLSKLMLEKVENAPNLGDVELGLKSGKGKIRQRIDAWEAKLGGPRSAELHFLVMLLQDIDRDNLLPITLIQEAVRTRQIAERTSLAIDEVGKDAPYSEAVWPWIRSKLQDADQTRRIGEDWLFASKNADWTEADKNLKASQVLYKGVQADAKLARDAFTWRDRALADLPDLTRWLAMYWPSAAEKQDSFVPQFLQMVEELSKNTRSLVDVLRKDDAQPRDLFEPTELVRLKHRDIQEKLLEKVRQLQIQKDEQNRWNETEAILATPLLVVDDQEGQAVPFRMQLLTNSRQTSSKFLDVATDKIAKGEAEETINPRIRAERLLRQRRLALAAIGPYVNKPLGLQPEDPPAKAGQVIGDFLYRLPDVIAEHQKNAQGSGELRKSMQEFLQADHFCRLVPAGLSAGSEAPLPPPEGLRRQRYHDFLIGQATRTQRDHWAAERESAETRYYLPMAKTLGEIAKTLADEAGDVDDVKAARRTDAEKYLAQLVESGLKMDADASLYWTSEKNFPLRYKVRTDKDATLTPVGVPMTWLDLTGPVDLANNDVGVLRKPILNLGADETGTEVRFDLRKGANAHGKISATLKCYYRGRTVPTTYAVQTRSPDVTVHRFAPPAEAGVAARLDKDFTYGAISIILDCSGSMRTKDANGVTRLEHAAKALGTVLSKIPENTYISVMVYINEGGKEKSEFRVIHECRPWKMALHFPELTGYVRERLLRKDILDTLSGFTPLARSFVVAREKGFPDAAQNYRGPKLILALTDGDDTETWNYENGTLPEYKEKGPPGPYNDAIRDYVAKKFGDSDVELHVVCFINPETHADEATNAKAQFGEVGNVAKYTNPGSFRVQPNPVRLADDLEAAIRPRLRLLQDGGDSAPGFPREGIAAHFQRTKEEDWKFGKAGTYFASIRGKSGGTNDPQVKLAAGDLVLFNLKRSDGSQIQYERSLVGKASSWAFQKSADETLVTVLQNQGNSKANILDQLIAVEAPSRAASARIEQPAPKLIWIENRAKADKGPTLVRWGRVHETFGPTYRVKARDWAHPNGVPVPNTTSLWWTNLQSPDAFAYPLRSPKTSAGSQIRVGGEQYRVEDVSFEDHLISDSLDVSDEDEHFGGAVKSKTMRSCLVLRMAYPKGLPCLAQLGDEHPHIGAEHRFYHEAGKYTALFWGLSQPDQDFFNFTVVNLDAMKKDRVNVSTADFFLDQTVKDSPYVAFPRSK